MGYYTQFNISNNPSTVQQAIEDKSQYSFYSGHMEGKWYSYKADCIEVSKQFPNLVIEVTGDGEEQGDQWKHYFKDGKSFLAEAVVTFEEFDESKLK